MRKSSPATALAAVALFVALGGAAVAATGDTFILGHSNSADATTSLGGTVAGATADIRNASTAASATGLLGRITSPAAGPSTAGVTGMNAGSGAGVVGKNTGGGPGLQSVVSGNGVPPLAVNSSARVPNLNADKLDGVDAGGFVPSSAVRRVGPVSVTLPNNGSFASPTLATFGQLSFGGYCADNGTTQTASVLVYSSVLHAAFVSVTGGTSGAGVEQNLDFNAGFPVTSFSSVPDGRQTMYTGVGTAVSANGHQVSFNVYAGQNIMGLTGQKCVFGGTFVAN